MDLMTRMCMRPTAELFKEQLTRARSMMPRDLVMHEQWQQTMNDAKAIRTFNDALLFVFVFLVGCPAYEAYVTRESNPRVMAAFMPVLRSKFESLILGRAPNGMRAESASAKEFQGTIDFVMAMRSEFLQT